MSVQPNDFRYFLTLDGVRTEIVFAPEGWDENSKVKYERSSDYFGMIRSWGLPLSFVLDGAKILRKAFYLYGIEAGVIIEVEQLNRKTWQYDQLPFSGDIDFSNFNDDGTTVTVGLMESGATRNIKAYESVKHGYDLVGDDVVTMELPGVYFEEKATAILLPSIESHTKFIPGLQLSGNSFQSGYVESRNTIEQETNDAGFVGNENWFIRADRPLNVRIKGHIKGGFARGIDGGPGFSVQLRDSTNLTVATLYSNNTGNVTYTFEFDFDVTVNMYINQKLFFYFRCNTEGSFISASAENSLIEASYNAVSDPSPCKGIKAFDLYKRIIRKITPGTPAASYLLSTTWDNLIFTSGDAIREIESAKIKISFKEFFNTINAIEDAGFGLEIGVAHMELASYFARNIQSINVGEVKDFSLTPAEDFIFNSLKIGYDDGNTEETNGKEEYNSGQEWQMPITRIQKEKSWISPTRADQYGIEKIRVDYNVLKSDKTTNDTSSDNDTFMLDCYLDGELYKPILGDTYQKVEGVTNGDTAYNLNLSPKKNLLRHGSYLHSMLDRMDDRYINFASGDKNTELKTVKNSIGVKENENIVVASLPPKYFLPYVVTFTCKLPRSARQLIDSVPFGYVGFKWNGVALKGYILEVSPDIARNTEQELTLLLTNDNNLLNLI